MNHQKIGQNFLLSCVLMNISHIYYLCHQYFKYDTTTNVMIAIPDYIHFPETTLCLHLSDVIDWKKNTTKDNWKLLIDDEYNNFVKIHLNREVKDQPPNDSSIHQFLPSNLQHIPSIRESFRLTKDVEDVIDHGLLLSMARILSPITSHDLFSGARVKDFFDVGPFLTYSSKCFQFTLKTNGTQGRIRYQSLLSSTTGSILLLSSLALSPHKRHALYLILPGESPLTTNTAMTRIKSNSSTSITYDIHKSRLLEHPFSSNCRHYDRDGFFSRSHCRHECIKKRGIRQEGVIDIQSNIHIYEDDDSVMGLIHSKSKNKILEFCDEECSQKECYSLEYINRVIESGASEDGFTTISYIAPNYPVTSTEEQPSILLVSFLTNVFSTFGFWLGVSVLGSLSGIKKVNVKMSSHRISLQHLRHQVCEGIMKRVSRNQVNPTHESRKRLPHLFVQKQQRRKGHFQSGEN